MSDIIEWAEIPGYPWYRVSTDGRIETSLNTHGFVLDEWKPMHPVEVDDGHKKIKLSRNGKQFMIGVHELVLICHGPKRPPGRSCALHGNGNPADNRLENLRWGFDDDNMRDRDLHGTTVRGEKHQKSKLTVEQVIDIRRKHASGQSGASLAREYGMHQSSIGSIVRGEHWRHVKLP